VHIDTAGTINNFGEIKGARAAVHVNLNSDNLVETINNKAGALLAGGVVATGGNVIDSDRGAFVLNNFGRVVGDISDNSVAGNDIIRKPLSDQWNH
jgi:hypothetical protein